MWRVDVQTPDDDSDSDADCGARCHSEDIVGRGRNGEVIRRYDVGARDVVAVKRPRDARDGCVLRREAMMHAVLARCVGARVPRFEGVVSASSGACFAYAMSYLHNIEWDTLTERALVVHLANVARTLKRLQDAFHFVHNDLSPSNLMVDACGIVHVIDFGFAQAEIDVDTMRDACEEVAGGAMVDSVSTSFAVEPHWASDDYRPWYDLLYLVGTLREWRGDDSRLPRCTVSAYEAVLVALSVDVARWRGNPHLVHNHRERLHQVDASLLQHFVPSDFIALLQRSHESAV